MIEVRAIKLERTVTKYMRVKASGYVGTHRYTAVVRAEGDDPEHMFQLEPSFDRYELAVKHWLFKYAPGHSVVRVYPVEGGYVFECEEVNE